MFSKRKVLDSFTEQNLFIFPEIITAIITHTLKFWISLLIRLWSLQNEQFMCS